MSFTYPYFVREASYLLHDTHKTKSIQVFLTIPINYDESPERGGWKEWIWSWLANQGSNIPAIHSAQWGSAHKQKWTPKSPLSETQISKHHPEKGKRATDIDITRYLQSFGSVCDLQSKGIKFKPCNTISLHSAKNKKTRSISLRDVEFRSYLFSGELKLPPLILGYDSQVYYTNLIAFEMCATGTHHNDCPVSSYISFMNSIIDNPEDVKELRSKHIILHTLSSDEEAFKTLKEISTTNWPQDFYIYQEVR